MSIYEFKKFVPSALGISILGVAGLMSLDYLLDASMWRWLESTADMNRFPYCETKREGEFLRQPANVYSNSIYLFYGVLLLLLGRQVRHTSHFQSSVPSILIYLLGASYVYLFFGSSFFHASFIDVGHRMDINATLAIFISLITIGAHQLTPSGQPKTYALLGFIAVPVCYGLHYFVFGGKFLFISFALLLFLISMVNYIRHRANYNLLLLAIGFVMLGLGYFLHVCDEQHVGCAPDSWFQLHSVWHFLTGTGGFLGFLFFYTKRNSK